MVPAGSNYMFKYRGFRGSLECDDDNCYWTGATLDKVGLTYWYPYTTEPTEVVIDKIRAEFHTVVDNYLKK